jgi:hypothetical protein
VTGYTGAAAKLKLISSGTREEDGIAAINVAAMPLT